MRVRPPLEELPPDRLAEPVLLAEPDLLEEADLPLDPFDEALRLLPPLVRFEDELARLDAEDRLLLEPAEPEPEDLRPPCWEL